MACEGDHSHRNASRAARDRPEEHLAPLRGHLLRVVQKSERTNAVVTQRLVIEENTRDDERSSETPAAGLVGTGDEPRTPRRRSKARSFRPVRRTR